MTSGKKRQSWKLRAPLVRETRISILTMRFVCGVRGNVPMFLPIVRRRVTVVSLLEGENVYWPSLPKVCTSVSASTDPDRPCICKVLLAKQTIENSRTYTCI